MRSTSIQFSKQSAYRCHGASTEKAGLRLDSYDHLMSGGKDGSVIVPHKPEASMLFARVTLPPGDPHFMPAEGRTPLTSEEISWIRAWIQAGATENATSNASFSLAEVHADPLPRQSEITADSCQRSSVCSKGWARS